MGQHRNLTRHRRLGSSRRSGSWRSINRCITGNGSSSRRLGSNSSRGWQRWLSRRGSRRDRRGKRGGERLKLLAQSITLRTDGITLYHDLASVSPLLHDASIPAGQADPHGTGSPVNLEVLKALESLLVRQMLTAVVREGVRRETLGPVMRVTVRICVRS